MMTTNLLAVAALLLAGCYNPDLSRVKFTCSAERPVCPDSLQCIQNCCGGPPCGAQSSADGGSQDPPPWDPQAKPSATSGCRSGMGYVLSEHAVACPGVLMQQGDVTSQCGDGWSLCPLSPLPPDRCASVPWGFFAAMPRGMQFHVPPSETLQCLWSGEGADVDQRFLFGCGSTPKTTYSAPLPCGGFSQAVLCRNGAAEAPMTCDCLLGAVPGDKDFASVTNPNPADGILCCKQ
jgi:hypothetical protein